MPIFIQQKKIKWHESEDKICITVPLSSRVDVNPAIFMSSRYLKLSSPPYLWECFLASFIDAEDSFARVTNETVSFELRKKLSGLWMKLTDDEAENEEYRKLKREEAFEEHQRYLKTTSEEKAKKQHKLRSESIRKHMVIDDNERRRIENIKEEEKERYFLALKRKEEQTKANNIAEKREKILENSKNIPEIRKNGTIQVSFTPREFPTAARESQEAEEKEWLEKQFAAKTNLKLDLNDLSQEEKNPDWLKSKAESMMKNGDFKSAVNAFSLAVRLCPNQYSLYSGRAACHLQLRNLHKAIEDSTKAIELLQPKTKSNADARANAHKIRGTAFQLLELPVEGLIELTAALKIKPTDEDLVKRCKSLQDYIGHPPNI